jgi:hypothetical protein
VLLRSSSLKGQLFFEWTVDFLPEGIEPLVLVIGYRCADGNKLSSLEVSFVPLERS